MKHISALFGMAIYVFSGVSASAAIHHDLVVKLAPEQHRLEAQDHVRLPQPVKSVRFELHAGLNPVLVGPEDMFISRIGEGEPGEVPTEIFEVSSKKDFADFVVAYAGEIFHPLSSPEEEYARGFSSTPGQVGPDGVYLADASRWVPRFGEELMTFNLNTDLPEGWSSVSQGEGANTNGTNKTRWHSPQPQDEILLIAARFTMYSRPGRIQSQAYLRAPDDELAKRYLDATAQYLAAYEELLGEYPYRKFALVENYWETGFGMPSFTLLGPKIIRFPFIINSSYPHEILHNWWGNGVFVDYSTGNWCEGLTAYLADHWMKEQTSSAAAADYRRTTLQKYSDFVSENNDFPLSEFHDRHNASSEAVGYGKALMFYHMLRGELGDDAFLRGLRAFYSQNKFRHASFADMEHAFGASGKNLQPEFQQWVQRVGAPLIRIAAARAEQVAAGYRLRISLEQTQALEPFALRVPLAIHLEGVRQAFQGTVELTGRTAEYTFDFAAAPVRVDVDPQFDLFRRLDPRESPAALSQLIGAKTITLVIPSQGALASVYERMAKNWVQASEGKTAVVLDRELSELPKDENIWVLGWENIWAPEVATRFKAHGVETSPARLKIDGKEFEIASNAFVIAGRNGADGRSTLGFVAGNSESLLAGVDRKLPHYSKYSYLVFNGVDATNVGKGIWVASDSPMSVPVIMNGAPVVSNWRGELQPRKALSAPRVPASVRSVRESVEQLSSEAMQGRELGSPELERVRQWLGSQMSETGLSGSGDAGSFFQTWRENVGAPKGEQQLSNVVGILPGRDPLLRDEVVVLGAHYDHLGKGWPDAREGNVGKVHPGADDNASGVAALLEAARILTSESKKGRGFPRSIAFVAFTGEEAGLLGSRHYAQTAASRIVAMINLDTVGSLFENELMVLGTGSALEWNALFASMPAAPRLQLIANDPGGSDQRSFLRKQIPAIQLFTGATANYHRPSDTAEKLDYEGLARVAGLAADIVSTLATRAGNLTFVQNAFEPDPANPGPARKAFLGTVPDFAFAGPGVKISSVVAASPAERAGLAAGDVLTRINDKPVEGLRNYSELLKRFHPGDEIELGFRRGDQPRTCTAVLVER